MSRRQCAPDLRACAPVVKRGLEASGTQQGHPATTFSTVPGIDCFVAGFATSLRAEANRLRRLGCAEAAATEAAIAEELEAAFERWCCQELTIPAAAAECGYSEERLRELVRAGGLPAVRNGLRGRVRVRRGDLPLRTRTGGGRAPQSDDLDDVAKRLLA